MQQLTIELEIIDEGYILLCLSFWVSEFMHPLCRLAHGMEYKVGTRKKEDASRGGRPKVGKWLSQFYGSKVGWEPLRKGSLAIFLWWGENGFFVLLFFSPWVNELAHLPVRYFAYFAWVEFAFLHSLLFLQSLGETFLFLWDFIDVAID